MKAIQDKDLVSVPDESVWDTVADLVIQSVHQRFMLSGMPTWKPTVLGNKPLIGSGALMNSETIDSRSDTHISISWGNGLPYAMIQQYGGVVQAKNVPYLKFKMGDQWVSKKSVKIPARPYVALEPQDIVNIVKVFSDYILNQQETT